VAPSSQHCREKGETTMEIVVCVKQVPDTETRIKIDPAGKGIVREGIEYVVNPYDEFAIEEALVLKEKHGGKVTVITAGPDRAVDALRTALAMGADEAIHIQASQEDAVDSIGAAEVMARALKEIPFDIILCGKQAVDDDNAAFAPALAEFLGLPHVTVVTGLEVDPEAGEAQVVREIEGAQEHITTSLPAVIAAQKGLNEPRYPALRGIMQAKRKKIPVSTLADLGLEGETLPARTEVLSMMPPPPREGGEKYEGEPEETVARLIKALQAEKLV